MAGKSTISITFTLDGDSKKFQDLIKNADGLKVAMASTVSEAKQLSKGAINFAALASGINAAQRSLNQLLSGLKDLSAAYAVQEINERKLAITMQNSMGATDAQIQSIKDLSRAQQKLGVIGAEVQLAGAQELATYLTLKSSLTALIPVLNDMNAQQNGLNATTETSATIAMMLGKVMNGKVSALSKYGYAFNEAQEEILRFGTEAERCTVLVEVVSASVGGMNAALAATDSGKQKQLENTLGGIKAKIGGFVNGALPFVTITAQALMAAGSIATLSVGIKTMTMNLYKSEAAKKVVSAATAVWTGVQKALNMVLHSNPIMAIITAVMALVAALVLAYKNCEGFRDMCNKVWGVIKQLATIITFSLVKSFEWLIEKCKTAWEWLKKILGLGGKKAEVTVGVNTTTTSEGTEDNDPIFNKNASTLKDIGDNLQILNDQLQTATVAEAALINKQIELWNKKSDVIKNAGKVAKNNPPLWKEDATTLKDITANIQILTNKLQTASVEEAALTNKQIEGWNKKADAISNSGKAVEGNTKSWKESAITLKDIGDNLQILTNKLQTASVEEAAHINQQIEAWNKKADAISNSGKAVEGNTKSWKESAITLKDIGDNLQILNDRLQTASISEAALINSEIELWDKKADAIRNAGKVAEQTGLKTGEALAKSWGGIKQIGSSVDGITNSLQGNGNAWQIVVGIVDGFIGLYQGIQTVVGIINMLTTASAAHAVTKGVEAGAETTEAAVRATTAATNAASGATTIVTNKLVSASWKELAASQYMAAHAYIPFAGFGIAAGFTAAMLAVTTAAGIPMLADGGIASGPTLAMVGEYAGASGNPEVIAPLNKLRGMLADTSGDQLSGRVEFEIDGLKLRGLLSKIDKRSKRG